MFSSASLRACSRSLLVIFVSVLFSPVFCNVANAQDGDATDTSGESAVKNGLDKAKSVFLGALRGEKEAVDQVFESYLLPAIAAVVLMIVGYMVASFIGRTVGQIVATRVDLTLGKFLARMVTNVILLLVGLGVLGFFGVDVTSFAAIIAAGGFAVGMALQGTLSNFAAGVMLLVFRPFKVGDYIVVSGIEGSVEEIDLFTTKLNSLDNRHLIVPNGQIFGAVIENCTRNEVRRVDVNVGVDYSADLRHTRQVLTKAVSVIPGGMTQPEPEVYLVDLGDSSVNWQLRVWCRPANYWDVRQRVTTAAKDSLDAAQIGIPFPQMDLHVVSGLSVSGSSENRGAA